MAAMPATEFRARVYEPGSPHPRQARVALDGNALIVRYDEGGEFLLPFEDLELRAGQLSQERVVLASQTTRQALVSDDRRLLDDISRGAAPEHLKKQISKNILDRKVGFVKEGFGRLMLVGAVIFFLGFVCIGLMYSARHTERSTSDDEEVEQASESPPPIVPGAPAAKPDSEAEPFPGAGAYMRNVQAKIKHDWHPPKSQQSKRVTVLFTVEPDGALGTVKISKSSGVKAVDQAAIAAVKHAAPFPPLPSSVEEAVNIQFTFDYNVHSH